MPENKATPTPEVKKPDTAAKAPGTPPSTEQKPPAPPQAPQAPKAAAPAEKKPNDPPKEPPKAPPAPPTTPPPPPPKAPPKQPEEKKPEVKAPATDPKSKPADAPKKEEAKGPITVSGKDKVEIPIEPKGKAEDPKKKDAAVEPPKGVKITQIFADRLEKPTQEDLKSLPIPKEGEGFSMRLHPAYFFEFLDHPFSVNRETDDYRELFDSVKENGINEPIKARPREGGGLELISGHRRHDVAMQLASHEID